MPISKASATWEGNLATGRGSMKPEHAGDIGFSRSTRFEGAQGSNPEEVVGAALAGCFSMALSLGLEKAGMTPQSPGSSPWQDGLKLAAFAGLSLARPLLRPRLAKAAVH